MTATRYLAVLLLAAGCGDNLSSRNPSTGDADAAAGELDAAGQPDAADEPDTVVVFDNTDGAFVWAPNAVYEGEPYLLGTFLDVTAPAASQTGDMSPSAILFVRSEASPLSTRGGFHFMNHRVFGANPDGAIFAAAESLVWEGPEDWTTVDDITVVPPLAKTAADTVGPDDPWASYADRPSGVQAAHFQDPGGTYGPDHVWFQQGIIAVRFADDDGIHYAFVELAWDPQDEDESALYLPQRWGYQTVPDQPLVIPP